MQRSLTESRFEQDVYIFSILNSKDLCHTDLLVTVPISVLSMCSFVVSQIYKIFYHEFEIENVKTVEKIRLDHELKNSVA